MSPSPFAVSSPTDPASYSWEATDEGVAERFGIPISQVLRFDLNTSPAPPALLAGLLAAGRFETPLSEYPPGDYRRLVEAAADAYGVSTDELVPGAGADEILDMCTKAFLPAGEAAVVSVPTYPMYRIHAEQRGGRVIAVPRLGRDDGWAMDLPAVRRAAREATLVWICNPNNPTGRAEPDGAVERLLADIEADAAADGRPAPAVVVDEAYSEFSGVIGDRAADALPEPRRGPHGLQGVRARGPSGRASRSRPPDTVRRIAPYRPPGLDQHHLRHRRHGGAPRRAGHARERRARGAGASAAGRRRSRPPAGARSRRSPTSCCSTSSRRSARRRPRSR